MKCYICSQNEYETLGTKEEFDVVRCSSCGFIQIDPLPDSEEYNKLYKEPWAYHRDRQKEVGHIPTHQRIQHDINVAHIRINEIIKYNPPPGKSLDIGCSSGAFVKVAKINGFDAYGIDLDKDMLDYCAKKLNLETLECGELKDMNYDSQSFNLVTLHDVFEHFLDARKELSEIERILANDGLLVIEGPDCDCQNFKEQGIDWKHVRPVEHPFYIRMQDYELLLSEINFEIIHTFVPYEDRITIFARKIING